MNKNSYIAPYQPLPWQIEPWKDKRPTILLAGPAGTGKSRLAAEKIHAYLMKYSNSTGLVVRKTRESMVNSTVLFLERTIIGNDPRVRHAKNSHRFEYINGSILAYGGMADEAQREQIRGIGTDAGLDIVWMEEATHFVESDYNEIIARMRGKAAPWQQIILSTNPGPPSHWINQRLILGGEAATYDKARPEDNPYNPPTYIEGLKRLTGILRMRLFEGKWVQAEGLVYSEFDLGNLTDEEPNLQSTYEWGCDDGYVDPRAFLFIQRQPDKILVFDELYHSRHLAETCVGEGIDIGKSYGWKDDEGKLRERQLPEIAIVPPESKELQGRLRLADIVARKADNAILPGIEVVRSLICDGNGYRTLQVNRRCKNFIRELTEGYVYPEGTRRDNEKPVDANNHACDGFRYWAVMRGR